MQLSIIIPAYNVEQWIGRCLESCLNQDIPKSDYEIIVVNDGSPDGSLAIAQQFVDQYNNIRIINRENGGLSAARNSGLMEAKGKYIWFVDADDWIEPNVLKLLLTEIIRKQLDVLCFKLQLVYDNGIKTPYIIKHNDSDKVYVGEEFVCAVGMPPAAWAAIYRREYLQENNLAFFEGILHEDQEFTPRAYISASRIALLPIIIYNYNQREGGIMKKNSKQISDKRAQDYIVIADSIYSFMLGRPTKNMQSRNWLIAKIKFFVFQSLSFYSKDAYRLHELRNKEYFPLAYLKGESTKEKIKTFLANTSLSLYIITNKIFK